MSKDNKKLIMYLCILFITVLLAYKLPHDSYSVIHYIIRPIRFGNTVLYLTGLIPLILFFLSIRGIFRLERFAKRSRIGIFLFIIIIILPLMNGTIDFMRTNYHWLKKDGINSVDIKESDINLVSSNGSTKIIVKLELVDYSRSSHQFNIRVYLPESLSNYAEREYYEFDNDYRIHGVHDKLNVEEEIVINAGSSAIDNKSLDTNWFWEETKYELYNEDEEVIIIDHGM